MGWLACNGHLRAERLPIRLSPGRYIVALEPKHLSGVAFNSPKQVGDFWVETNRNAPHVHGDTIKVITACGQDPSRFRLSGATASSAQ